MIHNIFLLAQFTQIYPILLVMYNYARVLSYRTWKAFARYSTLLFIMWSRLSKNFCVFGAYLETEILFKKKSKFFKKKSAIISIFVDYVIKGGAIYACLEKGAKLSLKSKNL
jgi:hypothetical protein